MAQAILLKDVETLGERGEVIDVSPGYLRNYLLPRKLAQAATTASIAEAERRQQAAERAATEQAGEDGRLFGSVTANEIVDAVRQARDLKLDKRKVRLEEPIRSTGTHMVTVEVADGVTADVKTIVTPQQG